MEQPRGLKLAWMIVWPVLVVLAGLAMGFLTGYVSNHMMYFVSSDSFLNFLLAVILGVLSWGFGWQVASLWTIDKLRRAPSLESTE